eukprot:RCo038876
MPVAVALSVSLPLPSSVPSLPLTRHLLCAAASLLCSCSVVYCVPLPLVLQLWLLASSPVGGSLPISLPPARHLERRDEKMGWGGLRIAKKALPRCIALSSELKECIWPAQCWNRTTF